MAGVGMIRDWSVIGSFDNDQGKGFSPPTRPRRWWTWGPRCPGRWCRCAGAAPSPRAWATWCSTAPGRARLRGRLPRHVRCAATAARPAQLRVSSASPTRAFVNDALVLSEERVVAGGFDNLVAPVALQPGWNKVLIKSAHRKGAWRLRARLTCEDGARRGPDLLQPPQPARARRRGAQERRRPAPRAAPRRARAAAALPGGAPALARRARPQGALGAAAAVGGAPGQPAASPTSRRSPTGTTRSRARPSTCWTAGVKATAGRRARS
jgi:hypothetical protein